MATKSKQMTDSEFDFNFNDIEIDILDVEKETALLELQSLDTNIITGVEQGTLEWLEMRKSKFTSSDFGKLLKQTKADEKAGRLSTGAMTYVNDKVKEMLYDFPDEDEIKIEFDGSITTSAMTWGHTYEDTARKLYSKRTTFDVKVPSFVTLGENIGSSTDGLIYDDGVLEIKNHKNGTWHVKYLQINSQDELKELKFDYYAQCQGELFVTKRQWCDFVSFDPRLMYTKYQDVAIKIIRIYPDLEFQKNLAFLMKKAIEKRDEIFNQIVSNCSPF